MDWLLATFGGRVAFRSGPKRSPIYEWVFNGLMNIRYVLQRLIPITHHGKRHHYRLILEQLNIHLALRGL